MLSDYRFIRHFTLIIFNYAIIFIGIIFDERTFHI